MAKKIRYTEEIRNLGTRIKVLCKIRDLNQTELANRTGIHVTDISRYINGRKNGISTEMLLRIADALETTPDVRLGIKSDRILCKNCYWWEKQSHSLQGRCSLWGIYPTGGWFCANAQTPEQYKSRKEECDTMQVMT